MASYLDAHASQGRWFVRFEDLDTPRNVAGADQIILSQLKALGMNWDGDIWYQSTRRSHYQAAFDRLLAQQRVYPCGCTRREIADSVLQRQGQFPDGERPYPGTCRHGLPAGRQALSWRFRVSEGVVAFTDRRLGAMQQDVAQAVGDFVLKRADGIWAYQLAVVVDDAAQGVTDIVRGEDLLSSTARQRMLNQVLGYPQPTVFHVPLVTNEAGLKLSKQNAAPALDSSKPLETLQKTWKLLGFEPFPANNLALFWREAIRIWGQGAQRANLHGC